MPENKSDYLMVLRGLSALAVVFCHYPFQLHNLIPFGENYTIYLDWLLDPFGYIPVLIFFSLSGYLITLGFYTNRHNPSSFEGLGRYYRSRIFRIIPLYYFSILFCVIIYWDLAVESPSRVMELLPFIENYKPVNGIIFNHVYWTMPIEMLFFLLAPFIYRVLKRCMTVIAPLCFFGLLTISFVALTSYIFRDVPFFDGAYVIARRQWSLMARFDFLYNLSAFILGGVGVFIVKDKQCAVFFMRRRLLVKRFTVVLLLLVTAYCSTYGLEQLNYGRLGVFIAFGLIPVMAVVVLGCAILNETQKAKVSAVRPYLIHLGVLSYGLYLFHMPSLELMQRLLMLMNISLTEEWLSLAALMVTFIVAQLAYTYVESPFLRQR